MQTRSCRTIVQQIRIFSAKLSITVGCLQLGLIAGFIGREAAPLSLQFSEEYAHDDSNCCLSYEEAHRPYRLGRSLVYSSGSGFVLPSGIVATRSYSRGCLLCTCLVGFCGLQTAQT